MAGKFSDAERGAILARSYESLSDAAVTDTRQISEPEIALEEILRQPCESVNQRTARKLAERDARWAAQRARRETTEAETMADIEARLEAKFTALVVEQRAVALELVSEALAVFDEEVCAPLARQLGALRKQVATLEAEIKKLRSLDASEPLDLPNILEARRMQ